MLDLCHITGKYRCLAHKVYNINVKLNHRVLVVFDNVTDFDSHLIMQKLGKFNFETKVIRNGLEKPTTINDKLSFISSFQFLSS